MSGVWFFSVLALYLASILKPIRSSEITFLNMATLTFEPVLKTYGIQSVVLQATYPENQVALTKSK